MLVRDDMTVDAEMDWLSKAAKPRRARPEQDFQVAAVRLLRLALPPSADVAAIKNEEQARGKTEGQRIRFHQRRKQTGVLKGFFDVAVLLDGPRTIWVELKAKGGRMSPEQRELHARVRAKGHAVVLAHSLDELEEQFRALGVPWKATL